MKNDESGKGDLIEQFQKDLKAIDPHNLARLASQLPNGAGGDAGRMARAFRLIYSAIDFLRKAHALRTAKAIGALTLGEANIDGAVALESLKHYSFVEAARLLGYQNEVGLERLIRRTFTPEMVRSPNTPLLLPGDPEIASQTLAFFRKHGIGSAEIVRLRQLKRNLHSEKGRKNSKGKKRTKPAPKSVK